MSSGLTARYLSLRLIFICPENRKLTLFNGQEDEEEKDGGAEGGRRKKKEEMRSTFFSGGNEFSFCVVQFLRAAALQV